MKRFNQYFAVSAKFARSAMFRAGAAKRASALLAGLFALAMAGGCSSGGNNLSLVSDDHQRCLDQSFQSAYTGVDENGDSEVVLVSDAHADSTPCTAGPLQPTHLCPRQVVHIRVFWSPVRGTHVDHPAATNAAIHWYVLGDEPGQSDVVQYAGTGFVTIDPADGGTSTVTIRDCAMNPVLERGQMQDPLGPAMLSGTITAKADDGQVAEILAGVKNAVATDDHEAASAN